MKLHLRTFGCRANHYDTELVRAIALSAGHEIVDDEAVADLAVFNSCAVTAEAERDLRKSVRRAASRNPRLRSVVMGCAAALPESVASIRALPSVETVVPGADAEALRNIFGAASTDPAFTTGQRTVRANLRVQDGCDEHCTFCATTRARGANRSRAVDEIVREAELLAEHHPEIVLTGTHIGTYGHDIGSTLGALVETLVLRVPRVRFRLSSVEATEVDARLAALLTADDSRLVPHLHAPLQSGSDRVLKRMGRHWYTSETYARAVERLVAGRSVFGLGADVITGFPGESEADFAATLALVDRLPFTYLHVFPFSMRPGTAATRLQGATDPSVLRDRAELLRARASEKSHVYRRSRSGGRADVVIVSATPEREAMTEDFLTVRVPARRARGERFTAALAWAGDSLTAT